MTSITSLVMTSLNENVTWKSIMVSTSSDKTCESRAVIIVCLVGWLLLCVFSTCLAPSFGVLANLHEKIETLNMLLRQNRETLEKGSQEMDVLRSEVHELVTRFPPPTRTDDAGTSHVRGQSIDASDEPEQM
ncbi:hypothetical protein MPTK1_8g02010 [Marchantia polymorpha subsp. ruderalis]|uniref:Uncharacterized protein n=1 Tax=Marchantia polymorpha TaxID=3197 RepID=A0A2R6VYK3_MARPO|nr:hypothetical protein MARPO_0617s0001 [Marchantia polymorpha]BBN18367.1 hypothetical protein Mp_8g02010 [Marchantia polymorpha subsp. ruderalis]|eukprot:PTQ26683.1 hypothetical protein MARPO_0617s0001 [Marchantia polymorpha]